MDIMDKIEVGEYIRTNDGEIYQIKDMGDDYYELDKHYLLWQGDSYIYVNMIDREKLNSIIKRHSKNLIDLIEKGDLVKIKDEHGEDLLLLNNSSCFNKFKQHVKNGAKITGILTHQRYDNSFYRIEEKE